MQESFHEDHKEDEADLLSNTGTDIKTREETKMNFDFPFDLNNLFSMQYSFDTLKSAIEFLAK